MLHRYLVVTLGLETATSFQTLFWLLPNDDQDPVRGLPAYRFGSRPEVPLIASSHRAYEWRYRFRPVVFMLRDPLDVLVSQYFHLSRQWDKASEPMGVFARRSADQVAAYLNSWTERLTNSRAIVVTYESMREDPEGGLRDVVTFLRLPVDSGALREAATYASFDRMRADERASGIPGHDYDRSDKEALRVRRGKVGGFRDYLSKTEVAEIQAVLETALSGGAHRLLRGCGLPVSTARRT